MDFAKSLEGIQALAVLIEPLESEEAARLRATDIQTDVELKLRLAGIKVIALDDSVKQPGASFLYVNVHAMFTNDQPFQGLGLAGYRISCELHQTVALTRDPTIKGLVTTWGTSSLGFVSKNNLPHVRDVTKDLVDEFINAYLSVNPKK